MKAKLLRIFNHFGIETQKRKLNEECYEFLQAVCEWQAKPTADTRTHVVEELADCLVVLKQFQHHFGIDEQTIKQWCDYKTERTLARIDTKTLTDNLREVESNL
jgi:NTP pyrophosphatase (non-canonical NTP hydrolase)